MNSADSQPPQSPPRISTGLGYATGICILLTILSGLFMSFFFQPDAQNAYQSVNFITDKVGGGEFAHSLHIWGALFAVILVMAHFVAVCYRGLYQTTKKIRWILGMFLVLVLSAIIISGFLTPWSFRSYWVLQTITNWGEVLPILSGISHWVFFEESSGNLVPVNRWFAIHAIILPIIFALCLFGHIRQTIIAFIRSHPHKMWVVLSFPIIAGIVLLLVSKFGNIHLDAADPVTTTNWPQPSYLLLLYFQVTRYCQDAMEIVGIFWIPLIIFVIACILPFIKYGKWSRVARYAIGSAFLALFIALNIVTHHSHSTSPLDSCAACHKEGFGGAFAAPPPTLSEISNHYDNKWLALHYRYPQFYWMMDTEVPKW